MPLHSDHQYEWGKRMQVPKVCVPFTRQIIRWILAKPFVQNLFKFAENSFLSDDKIWYGCCNSDKHIKRGCQERNMMTVVVRIIHLLYMWQVNTVERNRKRKLIHISYTFHGTAGRDIVLMELNEKYEPSAPRFVRVLHSLENLVQRYYCLGCTLPITLTRLY